MFHRHFTSILKIFSSASSHIMSFIPYPKIYGEQQTNHKSRLCKLVFAEEDAKCCCSSHCCLFTVFSELIYYSRFPWMQFFYLETFLYVNLEWNENYLVTNWIFLSWKKIYVQYMQSSISAISKPALRVSATATENPLALTKKQKTNKQHWQAFDWFSFFYKVGSQNFRSKATMMRTCSNTVTVFCLRRCTSFTAIRWRSDH